IMKLSDGLFLRSARTVAAQFPEIQYKELIVDNACMQIVMDPLQFDMLLLPNLYGDVMSDLAAGLVGGLGVVPSANIGDHCAMFEAVHGTAPDIAGKGLANPTALLMSALLMLDHLGERAAAERIEAALLKTYRDGIYTTRDVGGKANTEQFTNAVLDELAATTAKWDRRQGVDLLPPLWRPDLAARYWKGVLWSPSYFAARCGGALSDLLKDYIQQQ